MGSETIPPTQVILEVTTACNLRCRGCAIHGPQKCVTRPLGTMKEVIWRRAIEEIGSWGQDVNLTTHGGGEPLLHPDLKHILRFATRFPNIKPGFLTNGMLLDRSWSEFLVSSGLDWVAFSVDGISPATHRLVRERSDLGVIERNICNLMELRARSPENRPRIMLNMVAYDELLDQKEAFIERWISRVDAVMISHFRNPPDSKRWPDVPSRRRPCFLLWSQMVIAWDGRLGLCCEDFDIDVELGRVGTGSLIDAWNGPVISGIRDAHMKGRADSIPLCSICDTWADGTAAEEMDRQRGYGIVHRASQKEYRLL